MYGSEKMRSGLTRRGFLKATAVMSGVTATGSALSTLAGCGASDTRMAVTGEEEQVFYNACMVNCGNSSQCSFKTHVRDGRIVKISANTDMFYVSDQVADVVQYARRVCLRGRTHLQWVYSPERIMYPMRRVEGTERGAGEWERISWDEAIDQIASTFVSLQNEYGTQCIAGVGMTGNGHVINGQGGAYNRLMNAIQGTMCDYCLDYGIAVGEMRVTGSMFQGNNFPELYKKSKTVFCWGNNLTETCVQYWHYLDKAHKAGTKIVCVDPRYSITASKSDVHVPIKPGTDLALAHAMIRYILENDLVDEAYNIAHTCSPFLVREDTGLYLRMSDLGFEPEEGPVDPLTRQPTVVDPVAVWDREAQRPASHKECVIPALHGSFEVNGIKVRTALDTLRSCVEPATLEWASAQTGLDADLIRKLCEMYVDGPSLFLVSYGFEKYDNVDKVSHALMTLASIMGYWSRPGGGMAYPGTSNAKRVVKTGAAILEDGRSASRIPWLCLMDVLKSGEFNGEDYPIKAMINMAGNPFSNMAAKKKFIEEGLPKLEMVVTVENRMTDTARYSDIILPACHITEMDDFTNLAWMEINEKAIDPAGEAKPDWETAYCITEAMGLAGSIPRDSKQLIKELIDSSPEAQEYGMTYEDLCREKVILNLNSDGYDLMNYGDVTVRDDVVFPTGSGKLEYYCELPKPRMDYGQVFSAEEYRLPFFSTPREICANNPLCEKYPLIMWQEHTRWRVHTSFGEIPWLRELDPEPIVKINPDDARTRNIEAGDIVRVFNDRGFVVLRAVVDPGLPAGMCNVPKGWEKNQFIDGDFQDLTSDYCNPSTVNQSFYDVLVDIQKEG